MVKDKGTTQSHNKSVLLLFNTAAQVFPRASIWVPRGPIQSLLADIGSDYFTTRFVSYSNAGHYMGLQDTTTHRDKFLPDN